MATEIVSRWGYCIPRLRSVDKFERRTWVASQISLIVSLRSGLELARTEVSNEEKDNARSEVHQKISFCKTNSCCESRSQYSTPLPPGRGKKFRAKHTAQLDVFCACCVRDCSISPLFLDDGGDDDDEPIVMLSRSVPVLNAVHAVRNRTSATLVERVMTDDRNNIAEDSPYPLI